MVYKVKQEIADMDWQTCAGQCHLRFGPPTGLKAPGRIGQLKADGNVEKLSKRISVFTSPNHQAAADQPILYWFGLVRLWLDVEL